MTRHPAIQQLAYEFRRWAQWPTALQVKCIGTFYSSVPSGMSTDAHVRYRHGAKYDQAQSIHYS